MLCTLHTGESIPQMKEALTENTSSVPLNSTANQSNGDDDEKNEEEELVQVDCEEDAGLKRLNINSEHRVNTLFSGTSALTVDGGWDDSRGSAGCFASCLDGRVPAPPDNGVVAYVLRTGFSSSQGALMQMIEFSQQAVSGDSKETGKRFVCILFYCFSFLICLRVEKYGCLLSNKDIETIILIYHISYLLLFIF